MSSEKTLKEHISQLRIQLEELDKKLSGLEELQIKRNKIYIALEIAKESLPSLISINTKEGVEQDMVGCSFPDATYKFLLEQKKSCTVEEIANAVVERGVKSNARTFIATTRAALYSLKKKNKVVQINRDMWGLKIETIEDSNEHEKL